MKLKMSQAGIKRKLLSITFVGMALVAIVAGTPQPASATSCAYTVQPGDTLSAIARRFSTPVQDLALINGIRDINLIYADQQLVIPDCDATTSLDDSILFPRFLRQSTIDLSTIPAARPLTSDVRALAANSAVRLLVTGLGSVFQGSGSVIGQNGDTILTAYHVVARPLTRQLRGDTIELDLPERPSVELIDALPSRDLALLRVRQPNSRSLRSVSVGESDSLRVGDTVYLVGYPAKMRGELAFEGGTVIDLLSASRELRYIVTDAYAGQGSSGGLAINENGELIGVVDALLTDPRALEVLGYPQLDRATIIIPISQALPLLER